jgi:hypothetical protein
MGFFSDWRKKWGTIAGAFGAVVLFAQLAGALEKLEAYAPATHGWVRDWAAAGFMKRDAEIAELAKKRDEAAAAMSLKTDAVLETSRRELKLAQDATAQSFNKVFEKQWAMQDTIYAGQERDLRAELVLLQLADKDRPDDPIIQGRLVEIRAQLEAISRDRAAAACEQRQANNTIVRC